MRFYNIENVDVPSVTTIIQVIGSKTLMKWSNIMGFKRKNIDKILEDSSEFGNTVHDVARKIVDDSAPDPVMGNIGFRVTEVNNISKLLIKENETMKIDAKFTEKTFISKTLGFGGTIDLYGDITLDGIRYTDYIIDWKTSKTVHETMFLQTSAYKKLMEEAGYNVNGCIIINVSEKKLIKTRKDKEEIEKYSNAFMFLKDFFTFWKDKMH